MIQNRAVGKLASANSTTFLDIMINRIDRWFWHEDDNEKKKPSEEEVCELSDRICSLSQDMEKVVNSSDMDASMKIGILSTVFIMMLQKSGMSLDAIRKRIDLIEKKQSGSNPFE